MLPIIINTTRKTEFISDQRGVIYKFNFTTHAYELKDGNLVELVSVEDQVKQWLQFFISTEYKRYRIYEGLEYGLSLKKFIGSKIIPMSLIASDIEDQLTNVLKLNTDIKEIVSVKAIKINDALKLAIVVKTINGIELEVNG